MKEEGVLLFFSVIAVGGRLVVSLIGYHFLSSVLFVKNYKTLKVLIFPEFLPGEFQKDIFHRWRLSILWNYPCSKALRCV